MSLPKLIHFLSKSFFITFITLIYIVGMGHISPTHAQTTPPSTTSVANNVAINSHTKSQIQLIEFSSALICQLIGVDIVNPTQSCLGVNSSTGQIGYSPVGTQQLGGLMGLAIGGISATYQPPASTSQFTHYLASNFGILKPVLAQADPPGATGSFQGFVFLQQLFITTRDLTFMLLVILFIIIGVAIMLRLKIDPRTVMSIQNQIPKIIIGIVLISFSYAIAGFITDMMWVTTYFGINTIGGIAQQECPAIDNTAVDADGNPTTEKNITEVASRSLLNSPLIYAHNIFNTDSCFGKDGMWSGLWGLSHQVSESLGGILTSTVLQSFGGDLDDVAESQNCGAIEYFRNTSSCVKADAFQVVNFLISSIAKIIVVIAILLALTRVWLSLIKAYVYVLLDIITAPFQIGMGLLPGGKMGFNRWIRHIIGYLLVFPATATILVLASVFALNKSVNNPSGATTFMPPFLGNPFISNNLGALIAFGLIMITPELLEMIKDAMQIKGNDRITKSITGGFGRGVAPTMALGGFGKELFGKNKNGGPQIGRQALGWAGEKIGVSGRGAENRTISRITGLNLLRKTKTRVEDDRDRRMRETTSYRRDQSHVAYADTLRAARMQGLSEEEAHKQARKVSESIYKPGGGNNSSIATATPGQPRQSFISRLRGQNNTATTTPPTPTNPPASTVAAGSAATTGATSPAPLNKFSWTPSRTELKDAMGTTVLRIDASNNLTTPSGVAIPNLSSWLQTKNAEIIN